MSLLKSVIADARPAKSVQRLYTSPLGASGALPVTRSTDNMPVKSSARHTDALMGRQTQHEPMVSNPPVQDNIRQSSRPGDLRDKHSTQSKRFSRVEKSNSRTPQAKVVIGQQTGRQTNESAKPVIQAAIEQHSKDFPSAKFSANTVSLENHIPSTAISDPVAEKKPADSSRKNVQSENVKPSIKIQTLIQEQVSKPSPDGRVTGIANLSGTDSRPVSSASNENRIKPQKSVDRNFSGAELKQGRVYTEGSRLQQAGFSHEPKSDVSTQDETADVPATRYVDSKHDNAQHRDRDVDLQSVEKYESAIPSTESKLSGVAARLNNLELQGQQQTVKQSAVQVMAAQTTSLLADQLASQQADLRPAINSVHINPSSAEVRIGQVDVFIEKPAAVSAPVGRSFRPSISMASRHYLRRL